MVVVSSSSVRFSLPLLHPPGETEVWKSIHKSPTLPYIFVVLSYYLYQSWWKVFLSFIGNLTTWHFAFCKAKLPSLGQFLLKLYGIAIVLSTRSKYTRLFREFNVARSRATPISLRWYIFKADVLSSIFLCIACYDCGHGPGVLFGSLVRDYSWAMSILIGEGVARLAQEFLSIWPLLISACDLCPGVIAYLLSSVVSSL